MRPLPLEGILPLLTGEGAETVSNEIFNLRNYHSVWMYPFK